MEVIYQGESLQVANARYFDENPASLENGASDYLSSQESRGRTALLLIKGGEVLGGLAVAAGLFVVLVYILVKVAWPVSAAEVPGDLITRLGAGLVSPESFLLPFEVASVLLLVALVGAVIIARER